MTVTTCLVALVAVWAIGSRIDTPPAASPGSELDPTFAADGPFPGLLRLDAAADQKKAIRVAAFSDSGLVVQVTSTDLNGGSVPPYVLARITPTGALDPAFGSSATPGVLPMNGASVLAVDHADRIVIGGGAQVNRYQSDGAVDTSFEWRCPTVCESPPPQSTPGQSWVGSSVTGILLEPDGGMVTLGSGIFGSSAIVSRLLEDGTPDASFGDAATPGRLTLPYLGYVDGVWLDGGRIGVVERISSSTGMWIVGPDGRLDTTAAAPDGRIELGDGSSARIGRVQRVGDRMIISWADAASARSWLAAYDLSGRPDTSWGEQGVVDLAAIGASFDIMSPAGDDIVLNATLDDGSIAFARLTASGTFDAGFGSDPSNPGWVRVDLPDDGLLAHWHSQTVIVDDALVGVGRYGAPPIFGTSSTAEIFRTRAFPGGGSLAPYRYGAWPDRPTTTVPVTPTSTLVATTTSTIAAATTTSTPTTRPPVVSTDPPRWSPPIDAPATVGASAQRIRP